MFDKIIDDRLSSWASHRAYIEACNNPLQEVWDFWKSAPFIPFNKNIDPFYERGWPTPWEIIVENKYDDFTKALMIAKTLKMTERFQNSNIDIKVIVDKNKNIYYNVVCIDDEWALNVNEYGPISYKDIPNSFSIENIININFPS